MPNLRVLLVEDESIVAMLTQDMLESLGCEVAATAATLPQAMQAVAASQFDFALLDVNLAGERVYPAADALLEAGVPFAFCTGYGASGLPERFRNVPVLAKPFNEEQLAGILSAACFGLFPADRGS